MHDYNDLLSERALVWLPLLFAEPSALGSSAAVQFTVGMGLTGPILFSCGLGSLYYHAEAPLFAVLLVTNCLAFIHSLCMSTLGAFGIVVNQSAFFLSHFLWSHCCASLCYSL